MLLTATLLAPLLLATPTIDDEVEPRFEAPVVITVGGEPINDLLYPTPVLQDLDGDGRNEMVIGDLIGNFWVSERDAEGGLGAWTTLGNLEANGAPLRLNNW